MKLISLSIIALFINFVSCSSSKPVTTREFDEQHKKAGKTTEWDYSKIRDVQKEESKLPPAPNASVPTSSDKKEDCVTVTESQVQRGKLEGCTKVDPKAGFGENMFCCPTIN